MHDKIPTLSTLVDNSLDHKLLLDTVSFDGTEQQVVEEVRRV